MVLGESIENKDADRELADDLLAVCNYFVAKKNGMCSAENGRKRKREKEAKDKERGEDTGRKNKKNKVTSESETEGNTHEVVRNSKMDL